MATETQIQTVLDRLGDIQACRMCGTALRFGDYECPHCGADLEEDLRAWAERLINALSTPGQ